MSNSALLKNGQSPGNEKTDILGNLRSTFKFLLALTCLLAAISCYMVLVSEDVPLHTIPGLTISTFAGFSLLISVLGSWLIILALKQTENQNNKIAELTALLDEVTNGNYQERYIDIDQGPLDTLAVRFNTFLDTVQLLLKEKEQRARFEEASMQLLVDISCIREGDLTVKANVTEDTQGALAKYFNELTTNFSDVIAKTRSISQKVLHDSQSMSEHTGELVEANLRQAKSSIASQEVIKSCIRRVTDGPATDTTASAPVPSPQFEKALHGATDLIQSLQSNYSKLEKASETMSDFSDQTSILALNASIQATMNGELEEEEGPTSSFGLVAGELKRLSGHSRESSKEIEVSVQDIHTDLEDLAILIQQSSIMLKASQSSVTPNSGEATHSTKDQEKLLTGLLRTMEEMGEVCRKSALRGNEVTGFMDMLTESVTELKNCTAEFKIPDYSSFQPTRS